MGSVALQRHGKASKELQTALQDDTKRQASAEQQGTVQHYHDILSYDGMHVLRQ